MSPDTYTTSATVKGQRLNATVSVLGDTVHECVQLESGYVIHDAAFPLSYLGAACRAMYARCLVSSLADSWARQGPW
jgi:hypothetical protein